MFTRREVPESCVFTAKDGEMTMLNCHNWNSTQMLIVYVERSSRVTEHIF